MINIKFNRKYLMQMVRIKIIIAIYDVL